MALGVYNLNISDRNDVSHLLSQYRQLTFGIGKIENPTSETTAIAFGGSCGSFALLFLMLDLCVVLIRGRAILKLVYEFENTLMLSITIPLAAGIVGLFGFYLDIFSLTRASCIAVGIGWPFFLAALFNATQAEPEDDDPEAGGEDL